MFIIETHVKHFSAINFQLIQSLRLYKEKGTLIGSKLFWADGSLINRLKRCEVGSMSITFKNEWMYYYNI